MNDWIDRVADRPRLGTAAIIAEYRTFQQWHLNRALAEGYSIQDVLDFDSVQIIDAMLDWINAGKPL